MSNTYLAGEQTKRKIFKESKKLFYKNGFTETTYDDISNAAKVNRALIPYHFNNKQALGQEIYCRITEEFTTAIDEILDIRQFSSDFISIFHTVAYYRLLRDNYRFSRFVFQLQSDTTDSLFTIEKEREFLLNLGSKFSHLDDVELNILAKMYVGMKKEIIQMIYLSENNDITDRITEIHLHMLMGYAGYSRKKADELIQAAFEVTNLLSFHMKNGFSVEIEYN